MSQRPPQHQHLNPRNIIVVQTAFLGDIVLAVPLLENLRRKFPTAKLYFVTTPQGAELLKNNTLDLCLIPYDKRKSDRGMSGFIRLKNRLKSIEPDLVFCLHRSLRSTLLSRFSGGFTVGFREGACSWMFHRRVSRAGFSFEAEKNNALFSDFFGVAKEEIISIPHLKVCLTDDSWLKKDLNQMPKFAVIAPGSVWATKRWLPSSFAEIAGRLWQEFELRTVLLAGSQKEDLQACEELALAYRRQFPEAPELFQWAGKTNLPEMMAVCEQAKLVICNDSAPLHLAIGVGARVLGIFGPTTKDLGFFPLTEPGKSQVAELVGLTCRPCGNHGHQVCPLEHFRCMKDLGVDLVWEKVRQLLAG